MYQTAPQARIVRRPRNEKNRAMALGCISAAADARVEDKVAVSMMTTPESLERERG